MQKLSYTEFRDQVPTKLEYVQAFRALELELPINALPMLKAHYHAPNHTLTATAMAQEMDYPNYRTANLHYGSLGGIVCEELNLHLDQSVNVLADFVKPGAAGNTQWLWVMWPQVVEALEELGWTEQAD